MQSGLLNRMVTVLAHGYSAENNLLSLGGQTVHQNE